MSIRFVSRYDNSLDPPLLASGNVPGGPAGGDLTGSYPNPVLSVTGVAAGFYGDTANVPRLNIDGKGRIIGVTLVPVSSGPPTGPASGDLTGNYPAPQLANSGVVAGTYGNTTIVPKFTVDSKGRITNVQNIGIVGGSPTGAAGGDLTGSFPSPTLIATGVAPGVYGDATNVARLVVDSKGRITGVTLVPIAGSNGVPAGPAGGDLSGSYPNPGVNKIQNVPLSLQAKSLNPSYGLPVPDFGPFPDQFVYQNQLVHRYLSNDFAVYRGRFTKFGVPVESQPFLRIDFDASDNLKMFMVEVNLIAHCSQDLFPEFPGGMVQKAVYFINNVFLTGYAVNRSQNLFYETLQTGAGMNGTVEVIGNSIFCNFVPSVLGTTIVAYEVKVMGNRQP